MTLRCPQQQGPAWLLPSRQVRSLSRCFATVKPKNGLEGGIGARGSLRPREGGGWSRALLLDADGVKMLGSLRPLSLVFCKGLLFRGARKSVKNMGRLWALLKGRAPLESQGLHPKRWWWNAPVLADKEFHI